ncbi:MAG TPA: glycerate kinase [Nitrospira sp.]|nr:glycerate kinase [Nitrospira sp.]
MAIQLPASPVSPLLGKMIRRALDAVNAGAALRRAVKKDGDVLTVGSRRYDLRHYERVVVIGAGKATASMARAMEQVLGSRLHSGFVIVKYGHAVPTTRIVVEEAAHPLPDRAGQLAAGRVHALASSLTRHDLLIVLLSGGASSLMPSPVRGVTLADKQRVTRQLLRSGASIGEVNSVRKHLSNLKGGRLAETTKATVVTLILSDVLGDDLSTIASGPTAPDPTTYRQAIDCLKRYHVWSSSPRAVQAHLEQGRRRHLSETPKPGSPVFRRVHHQIIGNSKLALAAVIRTAREAGLRTVMHSMTLAGESGVAGARFGKLARTLYAKRSSVSKSCCIVAGGETTVTVKGNGKGGRAQEFAVSAAKAIAGLPNVWVAAIGTDGTDGPTDVAGALVSGETLARAQRLGVDLDEALARNNTYPALRALRSHIITGPTGTNVNDLYLLLIL